MINYYFLFDNLKTINFIIKGRSFGNVNPFTGCNTVLIKIYQSKPILKLYLIADENCFYGISTLIGFVSMVALSAIR